MQPLGLKRSSKFFPIIVRENKLRLKECFIVVFLITVIACKPQPAPFTPYAGKLILLDIPNDVTLFDRLGYGSYKAYGIYELDLESEGAIPKALCSELFSKLYFEGPPIISPDSKYVLIEKNWLINLDTCESINLPYTRDYGFAFSPDSKYLAITMNGGEMRESFLDVMNIGTGKINRLYHCCPV